MSPTLRFLRTLFGEAAPTAWVTGFTEQPTAPQEVKDPKQARRLAGRMWGGGLYRAKKARLREDANQYVAVSLFGAGGDGLTHRRKAQFVQMRAVMVDDIGPKVAPRNIKLPLTVEVETSPGNVQGWYALDPKDPDTKDRSLCERLVTGMIAAGLTKDLKDPGMTGVTRYGRLPEGINNKPGREPWRVVLRSLRRTRYKLREIAGAYGINLDAPAQPRPRERDSGAVHALPQVSRLKAAGLYVQEREGGVVDILCPWRGEHTGGDTSGTAYFQPSKDNNYAGGFKCHHGHCEKRTVADLYAWLDMRAALALSPYAGTPAPAPKPAPKPGRPQMVIVTGDALLSTEYAPAERIIAGRVEFTPGVTILAGKPKHGKSWMAMGLAVSAATGEPYMESAPVKPVQSVYVSCDDPSQPRFKRRLHAFKPREKLSGLALITELNPEDCSSLDLLDRLVVASPAIRFVVIDTLAAFRKQQRTESPYQQEYDEVKALNDWAHERNICVLLVHHLRKGEVDVENAYESISGTLGLQGACDGMIVLVRKDLKSDYDAALDEKLAGLWYRGRDFDEEVNLGVRLREGRWTIMGSAGDVFAADVHREALRVLESDRARWWSAKEVHAEGDFDCRWKTVQRALTLMARRGQIEAHRGALEGKSGGGGGYRAKVS